ncbi:MULTISPECIES: dTDP-4-dehydrorhamnose 3,5-epimerase [unclassified Streptomyces]|uniref:dTDP-4-dehydrorhamnose 3,5-epimerase n=1 Tax=unclassified Streptomyces TaxID=2593676 RepID=UPI000CD5848B|nr:MULTISPECIES: dTDP-4-dehydrorhamnose 3,5-epimerase [unclassified Streptomyces]AWL41304.1 dTDP-4-dehydrorhamnose 3,5-epimerase [Streptomyces sp. SM18]
MQRLTIAGAWLHVPVVHADERGSFHEAFRAEEFARSVGHTLELAQVNVSVSRRGTVRGIHFADVPPGQAKYVTCVRGAVLDVAVDLRVGSPGFGTWEAVELTQDNRRSLYLSEGLGHGFMALTDDATVMYVCSQGYAPRREHSVNPLDPALAIGWPTGPYPLLSPRDASAPTLAEALESGILPRYEDCASLSLGA